MGRRNKLSDTEFQARIKELEAEEALLPETWWYLAFVRNKEEHLGACFVRASGMHSAVMQANSRQLNPFDCHVFGTAVNTEIFLHHSWTYVFLSPHDTARFQYSEDALREPR